MVHGLWSSIPQWVAPTTRNMMGGYSIPIIIYIYKNGIYHDIPIIGIYHDIPIIGIYHDIPIILFVLRDWYGLMAIPEYGYRIKKKYIIFRHVTRSQGTSAWGRCTQRVDPCVREWAPWQTDPSDSSMPIRIGTYCIPSMGYFQSWANMGEHKTNYGNLWYIYILYI